MTKNIVIIISGPTASGKTQISLDLAKAIENNLERTAAIVNCDSLLFYKEISIGDDITVEIYLKGASEFGERFKFIHKIYRGDGILSAEIEIYAAWIDLSKRKLTTPPEIILDVFDKLTKTNDFEIIPLSKK